jgi:Flp pilus assembly pilin Flp
MNKFIINVTNRIRSLLADQDDTGAVAAEYGVLLAGIVAVVALGAAALGIRIGALFDSVLP